MNLNKRITELEREFGKPTGRRTIIWSGRNDDQATRSIVKRCRAEGVGIELITFSLRQEAGSVEEANAMVERHKAADVHTSIIVYLKNDEKRTVLARFNPALPSWLVKGNSAEFEPE
jgi:hypothetical protein